MAELIANGVTYSSKHVKAYIDGVYMVELKKVEYGDGRDRKVQRNWQGIPIGVNEDQYKADCKIELGKSEFDKLLDLARDLDCGIYDLPNIVITVEYNNGTQEIIDTISGYIKKNSLSVSENEEYIGHSLEIEVEDPILWNGVPAFVPNI